MWTNHYAVDIRKRPGLLMAVDLTAYRTPTRGHVCVPPLCNSAREARKIGGLTQRHRHILPRNFPGPPEGQSLC